ncbi:MAG: hypothetical protein IK017_01310 [Paludibacteraceae bacterium]|nr:hypothetical protein [Paludibacteraceae bacterium]
MSRVLKLSLLLLAIVFLAGCRTSSPSRYCSTIVGGKYEESKDSTSYFVLPYGSVMIPGKWKKTSYNNVSRQQFFMNSDSVTLSVVFSRFNGYEFNLDGAKTGYDFVKACYEWETDYFEKIHGLKHMIIEEDKEKHYMIFRVYDASDKANVNTYFLLGEKNGNVSYFSLSRAEKWTEERRLEFLRGLLKP